MEKQYTALIVGAGPVGLVTAHLLEKFNIKSLAIDKKHTAYTYPRAIGIDDETLRILRNVCLEDEEIKKLCNKPQIEYFMPSGYKQFIPNDTYRPFEYPILSTFYQPELEKILRGKLYASKFVTFISSCEIINFIKKDDYYLINVFYLGKVVQIKANYILGCDGAKSSVRRLCGIQFEELGTSEDWVVIDLYDSQKIRDNIKNIAKNGIYKFPCVTINFPPKMRRFEVKIPTAINFVDKKSNDLIQLLLEDFIKAENPHIIRSRVYKRNFCLAENLSVGNVYLLGDAAHLIPPYGGQGMCSGIRDSYNLCWKLTSVIQKKSSPKLLATYNDERSAAIKETMQFIHNLTKDIAETKDSEPINCHYYRKIKPLPRALASMNSGIFSSGSWLPSIFISKNNKINRLDDLLTGKWSILFNKDYFVKFKSFLLQCNINLNSIDIDLSTISNLENLVNQSLYEHNVVSLIKSGLALIIRPDLFIFRVIGHENELSLDNNIYYG